MARSFIVGRLWCSKVRDWLNEMKFLGWKFDYYEFSGWLSREFTLRGDDAEKIIDMLERQIRESKRTY